MRSFTYYYVQSKQDDEEEEPVKLDFSSKSINEVFSLTNQLTELVLETDPLTEKHYSSKEESKFVPYEEVCKDVENKRKLLLSFFILPNMFV